MGTAARHSGETNLFRAATVENASISTVALADYSLRLFQDVQIVPHERSEIANRAINIAIAAFALVLMLPVMALIALAVWLTSKGPIIYMQVRVGEDRRAGSNRQDSRRRHD